MDQQALLAHLTRARAALLAAAEGLDEAEMTRLPVAGDWTVRDILAHIEGWTAWDLAGIESILAGARPDFSAIQDVDTFNAQLVAARELWPPAHILAEMRQTQASLLALVANLSEEDLFSSGRFQGPYWGNLAEWLQIAWEHEEEHAAQLRAWLAGRKGRR